MNLPTPPEAINVLETSSVDLAYASSDQNSRGQSFKDDINWIGEMTPDNCLQQNKGSIVSRPSGSYGLNSLQSSIMQSSKGNQSTEEFNLNNPVSDCIETVLRDINQVPRQRMNIMSKSKKLESSETEIGAEDLDECLQQQKSFADYTGIMNQTSSMLRLKEN